MLKTIKMVWNFFNKKKTTIGGVLLLIAQVLRSLGQEEWAGLIEQLIAILEKAGWTALSIGIGHKAIKVLEEPDSN